MLRRLVWIGGALWRRGGLIMASRYHRLILGDVGHGTRFQTGVHFDRNVKARIGRNCYFWRGARISAEVADAMLETGDCVQVNEGAYLDVSGGLLLDEDVVISAQAAVYTHDHGLDPCARPRLMPKRIGQGAWIGMRAIILPGCRTIGARAVVGAGAVVTRDVPAGAVVAGNPAQIVGQIAPKGAVA